jgi:hypothetical protein
VATSHQPTIKRSFYKIHELVKRSKATRMVAQLYTAPQVIKVGLELVGFDLGRSDQESVMNQRRFKAFYGSSYIAIASVWEDLMTTHIVEARLNREQDCLESFLVAMCFLKVYASEHVMAGLFRLSEPTVRKYCWYYSKKVQALKEEAVSPLELCAH